MADAQTVEDVDQPTEPPARNNTVGGSVSDDEQRLILAAFSQAGFRTKSHGARAILLAYAGSTRVRDAVAAFLRDNPNAAA